MIENSEVHFFTSIYESKIKDERVCISLTVWIVGKFSKKKSVSHFFDEKMRINKNYNKI